MRSNKFLLAVLIGMSALLSLTASATPPVIQTSTLALSPLDYWRLNETNNPSPGGVSILDIGSNAKNGTYGFNTANVADGVFGPVAPAFPGFETTNGAIATTSSTGNTVPAIPPLNLTNGSMTIAMWIYPTMQQAVGTGLLFCRGANTVCGFAYGTHTANMLAYNDNNNPDSYNWDSAISPPVNVWSLVALTVTPTNASVYCVNSNGLFVSSLTISNTPMAFAEIGAIGGDTLTTARTFNGSIDEVAVFGTALTSSQIAQLYMTNSGISLAPAVTSQPKRQLIYPGNTAQFAVSVSGSAPFSYQWYGTNSGGLTAISGATNTSLLVPNVSTNSFSQYVVVITNPLGVVTSSVASLTIVNPSGSAFESAVIASVPYAYWRFNETNNPAGGTTRAFDFAAGYNGTYGTNTSNGFNQIAGPFPPAFRGFDTNNYAVATTTGLSDAFVTIPALNLNTNTVTISMWVYPNAIQPENTALFLWRGTTTAGLIYNGAVSDGALAYNWGDGSSPYLWDSGIVPPTNAWSYVTLVVTSTNATIYMHNAFGQASNSIALNNDPLSFNSPSTIGTDSFSTARTFNGAIDEVAVYNRALSATDVTTMFTNAGVRLFGTPAVTQDPVSATRAPGGTAHFTVAASGLATLAYQWLTTNGAGTFVPLTDGAGISGSSTTTLTISNIATSTPTVFQAVITNSAGSVTSAVASLTILSLSGAPLEAAMSATAPYAYWRFNETNHIAGGTNFAIDNYGGFNGTYGTNTSNGFNHIAGPVPPAFRGFETNNDAVATTTGLSDAFVTVPALNLNTNTVTISMWIYPNALQPENTALFLWRGTTTAGLIYNGAVPDGALAYNWGDGSSPYLWDSGLIPPTNAWSFVTLVVTPTNATIYMDNAGGQASNSIALNNDPLSFASPSTIGTDSFSTARTFNGVIDEVAVYNRALGAGEITSVFTNAGTRLLGFPAITQNPTSVLRYPGGVAHYSVSAVGLNPLSYQWLTTNGAGIFVPLTDGPNVNGSATTALTLSNVSSSTPVLYEAVASNAAGSVTSSVASLQLVVPATNSTYDIALRNSHPIARWQLNETNANPASGTATVIDYFGDFNGTYGTATLDGGSPTPVLGPQPPAFAGFAPNGGAVRTFAGVDNSYVTVPPLNLNTNVVTCTMWINPHSAQAPNTGLFIFRGGTTAAGFGYGNPVANELGYNWNNQFATYNWASGITTPTGMWSLVAWIITPTNATIYQLNSNGLSTASITNSHVVESFDTFGTIGSDSFTNSRTFDGIISDVAIFNQVLTQDQLVTLFGDASGIHLNGSPLINQDVVSLVRYPGATANFNVSVRGNAPFSYQWYTTNGTGGLVALTDGLNVSGSTTSNITVSNLSLSTPGAYQVIITNSLGSITSSVATLQLVTPPTNSAYDIALSGAHPLARWKLDETNGNPASGTITAFDYFGGFNGTYGTSTMNGGSATPVLGPQPPPFPGFVANGGAVETFTAVDNSYVTVPALNLNTNVVTCTMWIYPNSAELPDTGLFVFRGGTTAAGFGYTHAATNVLGYNWNNDVATYTWPSGITPPAGMWSLVAWVITPTTATIYQANSNGVSMASVTNNHVSQAFDTIGTIGSDSFTNSRTFNGMISDVAIFNHTLSQAQFVTLFTDGYNTNTGVLPPTIASQPQNISIYPGGTAQFTVAASGSAPFSYQWFGTNGAGTFVAIPGGTNATLYVPNVATNSSLRYQAVITNSVGSVTSSVASVTLVSPVGTPVESAVIASAPVAYWRFNETSHVAGTNFAFDYFGGYNGTYGTNTSNGFNHVAGPVPPAFLGFETNNDAVATTTGVADAFVTVPALNLNTNTVSISMWVYPNALQAENTALFLWRGTNTAGLIYNGRVNDGALAYNWGSSTAPFFWDSGIIPPTNAWSYVTLVVTPTNATIYMNNAFGQSSNSIALNNSPLSFGSSSTIGTDSFSTARTFNGVIDEVAVYNRALSAAEVATVFSKAGTLLFGTPTVTQNPVSVVRYPGGTARYTVGISGITPLSYQWLTTNGAGTFVPLTDGPNVNGSAAAILTLSNVSVSTPKVYEVLVTNAAGSVTSSVATLQLVIPATNSTYDMAVSAAHPVARWKLDETNANPATGTAQAFDYFGDFTGTYGTNTANGGSPTRVLGPQPPAFPGFATNGGAVKTLSGVDNSYVTVPALNLNTNVVTCTMWIYPNSTPAQNTGLFVFRNSTTAAGFGYGNPVANELGYNWDNQLATYNWASGISTPVGAWSFVAWVITSTNATIYQFNTNGLVSASIANSHIVEPFDVVSTIGSDSFTNSRTFNGVISDVAIFNQALSQQQILTMATDASGLTFPPSVVLQPDSTTTLYPGRSLVLSATAAGQSPYHYQWMTTNASGVFAVPVGSGVTTTSTNSSLAVNNLTLTSPARYVLVVTNVFGSATSSVASVTIVAPGVTSAVENAIASNNPVALWRLDETNADPAAGNALAFDYYGGFAGAYGTNAMNGGSPVPVQGPTGSSFSGFSPDVGALRAFNGITNAAVTVPALLLNTNVLTCSMWINPNGTQTSGTALFFCRSATTVSGFGYCSLLSVSDLGYTWNNDANTYFWDSGFSPPIGVWSFVTWVVTPTNVTLYISNTNGTNSASFTYPNPVQAFDAPSLIGSDSYQDTRTFDGRIADVALFTHALTPTQIQAMYSAGFTGGSQSNQPPQAVSLQILQTAGGNLKVSWPGPAGVFTLQANASVTKNGWAAVTNTPVTASGTNSVTLPITTNSQFFRLISH